MNLKLRRKDKAISLNNPKRIEKKFQGFFRICQEERLLFSSSRSQECCKGNQIWANAEYSDEKNAEFFISRLLIVSLQALTARWDNGCLSLFPFWSSAKSVIFISISFMETVKIAGVKRDAFGKKESKTVRKEGMVPCVIYGNGEKTIHFAVDARALKPLIYTPQSYLVEFDIDGKKEVGVMREVQFHPVKDTVLHVDFFHVVPGKPIAIDVPVRLSGNSEGVKQGGKLILSKRKVRISATMENLPDEIVVDVTSLGLGKSIFVGDLKYDNITILTPATTAICAVKMTRAARGAAAAADSGK